MIDEQDHGGEARHAANAWFRARRERRVEAPPSARRRIAIGIVALLHLALLLALRAGMQPRFEAADSELDVLEVRIVDPRDDTAVDPALAVAPPARRDFAPRVAESRLDAEPPMATSPPRSDPPAIEPATTLRLFEPDGSLRLSDDVHEAARTPSVRAPEPGYRERERRTNVWRAERPRIAGTPPTRFDRYWKPDGENLAEELVRKYPLLGLILQNPGGGDRCPPRSIDPDCEGAVQPAFPDDPYPDDEVLR